MRTVTYAVYDSRSGEIVHLHVEPAGMDSSPEEIIHASGKSRGAQLKVARVPDELAAAGSFRIEKGVFRAVKEGQQAGGAGINSPLEEPGASRKYVKREH